MVLQHILAASFDLTESLGEHAAELNELIPLLKYDNSDCCGKDGGTGSSSFLLRKKSRS